MTTQSPGGPATSAAEEPRCVVCGTAVGAKTDECPSCSEPAARWCTCMTLVALHQRECPKCARVIPRVPSLATRATINRRKWLLAGTAIALLVAGLCLVVVPMILEDRRLSALREAGIADAKVGGGRNGPAVEALQAWIAHHPEDTEVNRLLGKALLARGEGEAGAAALQRVLDAEPSDDATRLLLARHHLENGDADAALAAVSAMDEGQGRVLYAQALLAQGRRYEAAARLDEAAAALPRDVVVLGEAASLHEELAALDSPLSEEHAARARALWTSIAAATTAQPPANPLALGFRARALDALAPSDAPQPDVTAAYADAIAAQPGDADLRLHAYQAARRRRDDAAALAASTPLLRDEPYELDLVWEILAAESDAAHGDLAPLRKLSARSPADAAVASALARALLRAGDAPEARETLERAAKAGAPPTPEFRAALGSTLAAAGDAQAAERHYAAWRAADPADPEPLRGLVALGIDEAVASRRVGEALPPAAAAAEARLDELRALRPDDSSYLRWSAALFDARDANARADDHLVRLLRGAPEDAEGRALRIRRACAGRGNVALETVAEELVRPGAPIADVRVFCEEALAHGHAVQASRVAEAALRRTLAEPVRDRYAQALLVRGRCEDVLRLLPEERGERSAGEELRIVALALLGRRAELDAAHAALAARKPQRPAGAAFALAGRPEQARALLVGTQPEEESGPLRTQLLAEALEDAGLAADARVAWARLVAQPDVAMQARVLALASLLDASPADPAHRRAAVELGARLRDGSTDERTAALYLSGALAASDGDPEAAAGQLRRALRRHPRYLDAQLRLARALEKLGRAREMDEALRGALDLHPVSLPARVLAVRAATLVGIEELAGGDVTAARTAFARARRLAPPDAKTLARPAPGVFGLGLSADGLAACRDAAAARPGESAPILAEALALSAGDAHAEAIAKAATLVASQGHLPSAWLVRGMVETAAKRGDEALADLAEAVKRGARGPDLQAARALAQQLAGRRDAALVEARAARAAAPGNRLSALVLDAVLVRGGSVAVPHKGDPADALDDEAAWAKALERLLDGS